MPEYTLVSPTANPLRWLMLYERRDDGRLRTGYLQYVMGRGIVDGPHRLDVPLEDGPTPPSGPAATAEEALERSYPLARRTSGVLDQTYHTGSVSRLPDGGWLVSYASLEFAMFGRSAGVRVQVAPDGSLTAKGSFLSMSRRRRRPSGPTAR
jgi:hypothetical protein